MQLYFVHDCFNLPCYGEVTQEEQDYIINIVKNFFD